MIPYGRQNINQQDIDAVVDVLRSDYLTQGPAVPAFEKALTHYTGAKFALAVNSATSALHIACLSLVYGPKDLVWTSTITFVASANCAIYCGAEVDFVDIDPRTYNMSVEKLSQKLEQAKSKGKLPKVVIAVHLSGQSCDMASIHNLSKIYGFKIIEDASHAIGSLYIQKKVGSCEFSDITVFSFHPVKIVTTAEGGAALTNQPDLAKKMGLFRSHGITRDPQEMSQTSEGPWYYEQIDLGFNYRMTELQAALGLAQMNRLESFVQKRREIAEFYDKALIGLPLTLPFQDEKQESAYHLYIILLQLKKINKSHREVFEELRTKGIGVNLHYIPVHMQPYYKKLKIYENLTAAEEYYSEAISIPIYPDLTANDLDKIVESLKQVLK